MPNFDGGEPWDGMASDIRREKYWLVQYSRMFMQVVVWKKRGLVAVDAGMIIAFGRSGRINFDAIEAGATLNHDGLHVAEGRKNVGVHL